jgi:hypothetical protein
VARKDRGNSAGRFACSASNATDISFIYWPRNGT